MDYRVDVCEVTPQALLRLPRELRADRLGEDIAAGMRELTATVQRAGLTATGAPSITFPDHSAEGVVIADFGVPVEPAPTLSLRSGAEVVIAPGTLVARTCHRGGYAGLDAAYRALEAWISEAGYRVSGPPSEVYLVGPDEVSEARRLITEIRVPVEPSPAIAVLLDTPFAETVSLTREALRQQGFDVIAEVDMRATLRKELGEQVEEYLILGVCNPRLASRALAEDRQAGLLLPGNVVVRTVDSGTMVEAADPDVLVRATGHHGLYPVADEARRLLVAAIEALRAPTAHSQHGT